MAEKDILEYLYGDQAYNILDGTIDPEDEDLTIYDYTEEAQKGLKKSEPGEILKELKDITKKVSDYDIEDLNYWTYRAPSSEEKADKAAQIYKEKLVKKLESQGYIGDEYDRFDRGLPGSEEAKKSGMEADQAVSKAKAIARGISGNKKEKPYEGPLGKLGEYFSKNADAREKLFTYIGEMGKELVKPIEPGKAAAGALVPTLSRGLDRGQDKYQEAQAAEAKMLKDLSQAQKDANPLQFYTNKMKEARYMAWNNGIDPDSAEGTSWIGNWLQTQGVASGAADLSAAIKSISEAIMQEVNPDKKKDLEKQRDRLNEQLTAIVMQSSGGGYSEEVIDYDIYKQ
jgi:hypothetical protein|tara:strand:- start:1333 stop:2358 length:1026 start_codon:yes stop_codon:yes gene_type:complete